MRAKYIDSPLEFSKFEVKQKYFPFNGKTKEEIQAIITSGVVRETDVILYNYFEYIFSELEDELLAKEVWFYDMTPEMQRQEIDRKVMEIKMDIDNSKAFDLIVS